ncbi:MAG: hypothetical protein H0U42_07125, partial [Thermoleophilaceae bacterium]|nr:hypothetical protein [Thermoleophilaceae bacterium]
MTSDRHFGYAQFEFGFLLGPDDGRYLVRTADGAPQLVVVLETLGAPPRHRHKARRSKRVRSIEVEPVPTVRATIVGTEPFKDQAAAGAWLSRVGGDLDAGLALLAAAARDLNRVVRAHRATAADPYAQEVAPAGALVARLGYGSGEQAAAGRFANALSVPTMGSGKGRGRVARLSPQERLAAALNGREPVLACEELVLRARADLEIGQAREASLQARTALECMVAEIAADHPKITDELLGTRAAVEAAAAAALTGEPDEQQRAAVGTAVEAMERALRRFRA